MCLFLKRPVLGQGPDAKKSLSLKLPALIPYRAGDLWGYADSTGKIRIEPKYTVVELFSEAGFAKVANGKQWGLIDKKGNEIVKTQYNYPTEITSTYTFWSNLEARQSQITDKGKIVKVFPISNPDIIYLSDLETAMFKSSASVQRSGSLCGQRYYNTFYGLHDSTGKEILPRNFNAISYLGYGLFIACHEEDCSIIRADGSVLYAPTTYSMLPFLDGLLRISNGTKYGFINPKGELFIPLEFDYAVPFFEGLAAVTKDGKSGFINPEGKVAIPLQFEKVNFFRNGLAVVKQNGNWGIINKSGEVVVPFNHQEINYIKENNSFALLGRDNKNFGMYEPETGALRYLKGFFWKTTYDRKDGNWVLVSGNGTVPGAPNDPDVVIIPFKEKEFSPFYYGLAAGRKNGKWGVIDLEGNQILPFAYDKIEVINADLFKVGVNAEISWHGAQGLINRNNEEVFPIKFPSIGPFKNGLAEVYQNKSIGAVGLNGQLLIPLTTLPKGYAKQQSDYLPYTTWESGLLKVINFETGKTGYIDRYGKSYFRD